METKDIEILLGLREILENQKHYTGKDFKVYNALGRIFNDEEFERLHPRAKDGKFAHTKSSGQTKESNVHKLHIPSTEYKETLKKVEKDNQRNLTPEDIITGAIKNLGLDEKEVRKKIEFAENYNSNLKDDTKTRYTINGEFTKERKQRHKKILSDIFKNAKNAKPSSEEKPTVVFLGGRGGSGKSKFDGLVYDKNKYIILDADEIKKALPEYKGYNAAEVHEESSAILNQALKMAQKKGLNVVLDATMKTLSSTEKKIKNFKDADYNIEMYYMHLPREKAAQRAIKRYTNNEKGRYVPIIELLKMKDNEENFDKLKHLASKWAFYNNDVPNKEDKPILIDKNY